MRRGLIVTSVLLSSLLAAAAALATTQTARSGSVTATFSFAPANTFPSFKNLRLAIAQSGNVLYDQPVAATLCGKLCVPASTSGKQSSVHVLDLEHNGQPDVLLDLYSGGAHCCWIEQIFTFDPGTMTYTKTERDFGDAGEQVVDLGHNGQLEFLTADDSFANEFTDFAASGLPIQILTFSQHRFQDVTRSYPKRIAKDAAVWLKLFKGMARQHYQDSVGVIAAWAADEDLLGRSKQVSTYLAQQLKAGHLNSVVSVGGKKFVARLQKFLRKRGYLS
jgi:hypothetical protein